MLGCNEDFRLFGSIFFESIGRNVLLREGLGFAFSFLARNRTYPPYCIHPMYCYNCQYGYPIDSRNENILRWLLAGDY